MLTTDRLQLQFATPDAARALGHGPGEWRWLGGGPGTGTRELAGIVVRAAEVGWHRPPWGLYVAVRQADGLAVGSVGFHGPPATDGSVEVGYDLVPGARGAGYATEAVLALVGFAFTHPAVRTVLALTTPDNTASQRVLARAGFSLDGEEPDRVRRYRVDR
ncbi:GNAT family N-acetyltransferase [Streptacidiphilus sp. EB129]|uniref:GNAT family N-acetyltransferase n=1 Tax=Streptacidiphilus sp. EB129 TaxID=3156262 RepID=UPI003519D08E